MDISERLVDISTSDLVSEIKGRCSTLVIGYQEKGTHAKTILIVDAHGEDIGSSLFIIECLKCKVMRIDSDTLEDIEESE